MTTNIPPAGDKRGTSRTRLEWALWYATVLGWFVLILHSIVDGVCDCGGDCGKSAAKHPWFSGGFHGASRDPAQITAWFAQHPDANIGIRTGAESGIVVIDIDPGKGGADNLRALEA
jgi:putative DNA primase/helicase